MCHRHDVSEAIFYKWKAKYGGVEVSEARRLKALEDENAPLKKLLAESVLNEAALRELPGKKWEEAGSCCSFARNFRDERASGLPGDCRGSYDGTLSLGAAG